MWKNNTLINHYEKFSFNVNWNLINKTGVTLINFIVSFFCREKNQKMYFIEKFFVSDLLNRGRIYYFL